jgi:hypothetical protein
MCPDHKQSIGNNAVCLDCLQVRAVRERLEEAVDARVTLCHACAHLTGALPYSTGEELGAAFRDADVATQAAVNLMSDLCYELG